jgi:hypothetical protein
MLFGVQYVLEFAKTVPINVTTTPKPPERRRTEFYLYVPCHRTAALSPSAIISVHYTHPAEERKDIPRERARNKRQKAIEVVRGIFISFLSLLRGVIWACQCYR